MMVAPVSPGAPPAPPGEVPDRAARIDRAGLGTERARVAGAMGVVPRGDAGALVRVVRHILATPAANPPDPA